jgi:hypothetical protein
MNVQLFHTERGSELNNQLIAEAMQAFGIQRSLCTKGHMTQCRSVNVKPFWTKK